MIPSTGPSPAAESMNTLPSIDDAVVASKFCLSLSARFFVERRIGKVSFQDKKQTAEKENYLTLFMHEFESMNWNEDT